VKSFNLLALILIVQIASASEADKVKNKFDDRIKPCMNIKYSPDVIDCMMKEAKKAQTEYNREFENYLKSTKNQDEITHNKNTLIKLANKAKSGWDLYMENECLAEASVYENHNDGYNATYNTCLIDKYNQRIEYYKSNKF
jgi:uncharacterized protein YecT (DUF1311 family)